MLGNPIYGSTRIGMANTQARIVNIVRVETVSSNTTITVSEVKVDKAAYYGNKRYEMVGNTGSVHVVISDRKIVTSSGISADILEVNDYYAWGQEIKSRSWTIESDRYLFGYQDMLRENTVNGQGNMYSTEFRMFDARLGRWMSLDPLMDQFPWMSPFVAFDNNPIYFTDPYGLNTIEKDFGEGMGGGPGDGENNGNDGKGTKTKEKEIKKLKPIIIKQKSWWRRALNKVKIKLVEGSKKAWKGTVNGAKWIWRGIKVGYNKVKTATIKGLQATERGINNLKNKKIKSGLMEWGDGKGGTENSNDHSNPAGSIDVGDILKMFDLFGVATKTQGENQIGGPADKYTGLEKSNDLKEINEYDPDEVDEDFEAIDNLSKGKKSPVVKKQTEKTIKVVIYKNNYRDDGSIWSTTRVDVINVSKREFIKNYSDAFKIVGDSEANYGVIRD